MKDIAVKKGIPIETNAEKKFTLFEDAPEVEKVGAWVCVSKKWLNYPV